MPRVQSGIARKKDRKVIGENLVKRIGEAVSPQPLTDHKADCLENGELVLGQPKIRQTPVSRIGGVVHRRVEVERIPEFGRRWIERNPRQIQIGGCENRNEIAQSELAHLLQLTSELRSVAINGIAR